VKEVVVLICVYLLHEKANLPIMFNVARLFENFVILLVLVPKPVFISIKLTTNLFSSVLDFALD
jgi:hypothetical protein